MALDERLEQQLYDAIEQVVRIPRPIVRERIMKNAADGIMRAMNWKAMKIKDD